MTQQMNFGLAILRMAAGAMILMHGYAHIRKGGKSTINNTAKWFGSMGMRPPLLQAWLASITELTAGFLLLLGLFTPLAAAMLFGVMLVAFLIAHRQNGFFIYNPGQGWEYVAIIMVICVVLGALGGGEWSVDHWLADWWTGWRGVLTVLLLGGGGAVALLATCWRPPTKP